MEMVSRRIIFRRSMLMARRTDLVPIMFETSGMGIVAIGTANIFVVHPALDERSEDIVLVQNLPVGIVGIFGQQFVIEVVVEIVSRPEIRCMHTASRVTRSTHLNLRTGVDRLQFGQSVASLAIPKQRLLVGELYMQTCRPMTRFTTDVDLGESGVVG